MQAGLSLVSPLVSVFLDILRGLGGLCLAQLPSGRILASSLPQQSSSWPWPQTCVWAGSDGRGQHPNLGSLRGAGRWVHDGPHGSPWSPLYSTASFLFWHRLLSTWQDTKSELALLDQLNPHYKVTYSISGSAVYEQASADMPAITFCYFPCRHFPDSSLQWEQLHR